MSIQVVIPHRNNGGDASRIFLDRYARIFRKGFVQAWKDPQNIVSESCGPIIAPVSGQLFVDVQPSAQGWIAISDDGMVLKESSSTYRLAVAASTKNYIVLHAKYVPTVGATISEFTTLTTSAYNASPIKREYVIVGTLTLGATADASTGTVSYTERDRVEGLYDASWRPSVSTFASLPTISTDPFLKTGDFVIVRDTLATYGWNGSAWIPATGVAELHGALGRGDMAQAEYMRSVHGSGVLSGPMGDEDGYSRRPGLEIHEHSGFAGRIGLGEIRSVVNGHWQKTKHIDYTGLSAKPGSGTRYDLVYLEMYRAEVTPSSTTYESHTAGPLTAANISLLLERLTASSGENAQSFDLGSIERTHDSKYLVNVYSIRNSVDITLDGAEDPYDLASFTTPPVNSEGNSWAYSASASDPRVWISTHTSSYDGRAWAIPLLVIKRTDAESPGILVFRSGLRHVFPVYPECDAGPMAKGLPSSSLAMAARMVDQKVPSGVLDINEYVPSAGFAGGMGLVVNGYKVIIPEVGTVVASVPASPGSGGRRDLVYAAVRVLAYPDQPAGGRTILSTGEYRQVASYEPGYRKEAFLQVDFVQEGAGEVEDVHDAMTALGFSRVTTDAGLYRKADASFDDRVNFDGFTYAIPISIIPRFNSASFNVGTNPNGGGAGTRPDGLDHTMLDARAITVAHLVNADRMQLERVFNKSFDQLIRGQLRTLVQRHPSHAGVAGASFTMAEAAAGGPTAGFTIFPAPPDGIRDVWSEAIEVRPFGASWGIGADYSDGVFTYDESAGTINITMPEGMAIYTTDTNPNTIHFVAYDNAGPPSTPVVCVNDHTGAGFSGSLSFAAPWTVVQSDSFGNPTEVDLEITYTGTGFVRFFFWVVMQRSDSDTHHQSNGGLTGIPDQVYGATYGPSNTEVGVKPMMVGLSKVAAGATVTFTSADLAAATPEGGTPGFRALLGVSVTDSNRASYGYSAQMSDAQDSLSLTFSPSVSGETVYVLVAYSTTTVDRWLEFSRAGKSVSGFYSWFDEEWDGQVTDRRVVRIGTGSTQTRMAGCLWFRDQGSNDPWDFVESPEDVHVRVKEGTDIATISDLDAGAQSAGKEYRMVVMVSDAPAASGEDFKVFYETTPYQGISESFSAASKKAAIKDRLQGEVLLPGRSFVTTAGYAGYYIPPGASVNADIPHSALDQDMLPAFSNRAAGMALAGTGIHRLRVQDTGTSDTASRNQYSTMRSLYRSGMDAVVDRLPWPNFSGVSVSSGGNVDWLPTDAYGEWDLSYGVLRVGGGLLSNNAVSTSFYISSTDVTSAEELGARSPQEGLLIGYGDYDSTVINRLEDNFMAAGDRGVSITMFAFDTTNDARAKFVSSSVAFLAPGNMEGLFTSDMNQGVAGFDIPEDPPTFLNAGVPFRLNTGGNAATRYYGGHAMLVRGTATGVRGLVSLQVSGSPREISQAFPQLPYAAQIGGVFDAFWPVHRPLISDRRA